MGVRRTFLLLEPHRARPRRQEERLARLEKLVPQILHGFRQHRKRS